jgi:hypothetical protein
MLVTETEVQANTVAQRGALQINIKAIIKVHQDQPTISMLYNQNVYDLCLHVIMINFGCVCKSQ